MTINGTQGARNFRDGIHENGFRSLQQPASAGKGNFRCLAAWWRPYNDIASCAGQAPLKVLAGPACPH
jgi:hypothetical protein